MRELTAHDCKIAPSTYYARTTHPLCARAVGWQHVAAHERAVRRQLRQRPSRDRQRLLQELIRVPQQGPWRTVDDVELATLGWVHRHNTTRLQGHCGDVPPAEFETAFYAAQQPDQPVGIQ